MLACVLSADQRGEVPPGEAAAVQGGRGEGGVLFLKKISDFAQCFFFGENVMCRRHTRHSVVATGAMVFATGMFSGPAMLKIWNWFF